MIFTFVRIWLRCFVIIISWCLSTNKLSVGWLFLFFMLHDIRMNILSVPGKVAIGINILLLICRSFYPKCLITILAWSKNIMFYDKYMAFWSINPKYPDKLYFIHVENNQRELVDNFNVVFIAIMLIFENSLIIELILQLIIFVTYKNIMIMQVNLIWPQQMTSEWY